MTTKAYFKAFKILVVLSCLAACESRTYIAPVVESRRPPSETIDYHIVAKGETLYSIAWRYNLDYQKISKINGLDSNYRIWPGQKLLLSGDPKPTSVQREKPTKTRSQARTSELKKTPVKSIQPSTPVIKKSTEKKAKVTPGKKSNFRLSWGWPLKGKILRRFDTGTGLNKGIDVQAKLRQPVLAAEAGEVVYAGSGLRGYGKLLIVKHSEKFLSAYGHNHTLLVKEGENVTKGQKIAEAGATGTNETKLHFEIRLDGKPVDPLKYLP